MEDYAEVVLLTTSLGSIRQQFYDSKRATNFLDCKDVIYYLIDANRDVSQAKDLADVQLYKMWKESGILKSDDSENNEESSSDSVMIPQLIVDGISVGGMAAIQDLEEDGDLEWILARAACPSCLYEKEPTNTQCSNCQAVYTSIVPPDVIAAARVVQVYRGEIYNSIETGLEKPHFAKPGGFGYNQTTSQNYEELFGEPPPDDANELPDPPQADDE